MRCRNCVRFSELAAKGTGVCNHPTNDVEYPAKKLTTSTDSCEKFEPKHPARRRTKAAVAPSADARHIAEAITAGFERLAGVLEYAFTAGREDDDTAFATASRAADRLHDISDHFERVAEAFAAGATGG